MSSARQRSGGRGGTGGSAAGLESWPWPWATLFPALDTVFPFVKGGDWQLCLPQVALRRLGGVDPGVPHPRPRLEGCWATKRPRFSLHRKPATS